MRGMIEPAQPKKIPLTITKHVFILTESSIKMLAYLNHLQAFSVQFLTRNLMNFMFGEVIPL